MSLIMRYRYCPSVDMNTFSVLLRVCDHEMNRSDEEVAELPSNSSFSIVGSIVSFVVTLYFIFPPLESRRTHRRTKTMWIWWYYGKREAEEINSNWINSYEGIHRTVTELHLIRGRQPTTNDRYERSDIKMCNRIEGGSKSYPNNRSHIFGRHEERDNSN